MQQFVFMFTLFPLSPKQTTPHNHCSQHSHCTVPWHTLIIVDEIAGRPPETFGTALNEQDSSSKDALLKYVISANFTMFTLFWGHFVTSIIHYIITLQ